MLSFNMLTAEQQRYLDDIWSDPNYSVAFAGPEKLYKFVKKEGKFKLSLGKIRRYLSDKESYSLQKRVQRKFKRPHIIVQGIDTQWEADLADVKSLSKYNVGVDYILVVLDVFSRFLFTSPLKNKKASSVLEAIQKIFRLRKPAVLRTDKGAEFKNVSMSKFLESEGVRHIFSQNETKAAYVERAIQNLKNRIYRLLEERQSNEYIKDLSLITKGINDTPSRPLGDISPSKVTKENSDEVRLNAYLVRTKTKLRAPQKIKKSTDKKTRKKKHPSVYKFKIGDRVRITHLKKTFMREYHQKWSGEIFVITQRYKRDGLPVYKLKDFAGDAITGTFYSQELQKVNVGTETEWKVDNVLKRRKVKGIKQVLVRWRHWPSKYDSWINESELKAI